MDLSEVTGFHLDVLREIGNIGVGNAATSLAQILGRKINMAVPNCLITPISEVPALVGSEEEMAVCINFLVKGAGEMQMLFALRKQDARSLLSLLGVEDHKEAFCPDQEPAASALREIGNILTGSFLNAFSDFTKLTLIPSVPAMAYDMLGAVISTALLEGGYTEDLVLVIETDLFSQEISVGGHFFFLPKGEALDIMLKSLGLEADKP